VTGSARRIVVIGRNGQVSRSLGQTLGAAGHDVIQLARPVVDLLYPTGVADAISAVRPDLVVNAAAYTGVDAAEDDSAIAEAINASGAETAARAAAASGAPIIHFSTDYVFDGIKTSPYVETDPVRPLSVYGRSKLEGERRVAAANPCHIILRTAWVNSPYGSNFVKTILRLARERDALRVVDDQKGNPTFAADLADMVCQIVPTILESSQNALRFGVFHAVCGGQATWFDLAQAVMNGAAARGNPNCPVKPIKTSDYPTKAQRPAYSVLSTEKLHAVYGIRLPHWKSSLSRCLDHLACSNDEKSRRETQPQRTIE
jgi:dTDP-4-dehydrorhamnose reductase